MVSLNDTTLLLDATVASEHARCTSRRVRPYPGAAMTEHTNDTVPERLPRGHLRRAAQVGD
jgi:hypothetical protein